uniref:Uncharacterized protein n=1 Tax=Xiphophorus couchianus TaxID=32473 RepID=A0A3B5L138_9TELE
MAPVGESQVKHLVTTLELPLPPQELISGDRLPLSAGQAGSQHGIVGQMQEDLQNQAVRQTWTPIHPNILEHTQRCEQVLSYYRFLQGFFCHLKGFRSN